jgi:hypothetical protein
MLLVTIVTGQHFSGGDNDEQSVGAEVVEQEPMISESSQATVPTLILSSRYTEDSQRLWRAAIQRGWKVERIHGWRIPDHLRRVQEPVLYLEALMAPTLAEAFGLTLLEPPDDWLPRLPIEYRQRTVQLTTLGEARQTLLPAFVKPPNDKSFPARVYDAESLPTEFPDDMLVLVAEVVTWEKEFRCFILDRTLRTFSVYLRNGELQREYEFASTDAEADELVHFVTQVLRDDRVLLPCATVLDIGVIQGRGWAVVELNAAWGAGIYGCDPGVVLDVVRYAAVRDLQGIGED